MLETPDKVFTLAVSTDEEGPLNLLFASCSGDESIFREETLNAIATDPLFMKVMGGSSAVVLVRLEDHPLPVVLATQDVMEHAVDRLDNAKKGEKIIALEEAGTEAYTRKTIDVYDTYYSCKKPHKTVVGCSDCVSKSSRGAMDCAIKKFAFPGIFEDSDFSPEDLKDKWKSRREKIAGFTFVSPRLTSMEEFAPYFRQIYHHDFSMIGTRSASVSAGLIERGRLGKFKKEVCSRCFLETYCADTYRYDNWGVRGCEGNYPRKMTDAYTQILNRAVIPYTHKELAYLMKMSGPLTKRYNRRKYAATFRLDSTCHLEFGLRPKTSPFGFMPFDSYKEAAAFLKEYAPERSGCLTAKDMTVKFKAMLIETASLYEIRYSGGFGGSTHVPYYITASSYENQLHIKWLTESGREVWGDSHVKHLSHVYQIRHRYRCLSKVPNPLRRRADWEC